MTNKFYFAPPRQGKTFVVVAEALDYLKKGKTVYSNFPIITPDGLQSQVWQADFIYKNIQNALVIIDEAQQDFDSQTHKALNEDEDAFFATSGHNGSVYLINDIGYILNLFSGVFPGTWTVILGLIILANLGLRIYWFVKDISIVGNKI